MSSHLHHGRTVATKYQNNFAIINYHEMCKKCLEVQYQYPDYPRLMMLHLLFVYRPQYGVSEESYT